MFSESYLEFLENFQLPPYKLEKVEENYVLEFRGFWGEVTYWEIPALAIVNELYFHNLMKPLSKFERKTVYGTRILRLAEKIKKLQKTSGHSFL